VGKSEGSRPFGRVKNRWQCNIKVKNKDTG
jgi:hypothetical protein